MAANKDKDVTELTFTAGKRRKSYIFCGKDGFSYYYNKLMKGGRVSLECVKRKSQHCLGRASVRSDGSEFKVTQQHSHANDHHYFSINVFRQAVLKRCREGDTSSLRFIYNDERRKMSQTISREVCANIPFVSLRPAMARARQHRLPKHPDSLTKFAEIIASDEYGYLGRTLDGEDHILAGFGGNTEEGTSFVILASERMLAELAKTKKVFSDATFCTPAHLKCRQIWNIITLREHQIMPLARVLMQTKKKTTYKLALEKLKELCPDFQAEEVMCDFENAALCAWREAFPAASLHGCLFHSSKAIAKHARKLGMIRLLKTNRAANSIVRSMCALALLPSSQISKGLGKLAKRAHRERLWHKLYKLFGYFRVYWLPRSDVLSVYECPDRTNNACESDNRNLSSAVKFKHPGIFFLLKGILEMEDDAFQDLQVMRLGHRVSRKRRVSVLANDAQIHDLTTLLKNKQISCVDFLRIVSRRLHGGFNIGLGT